MKIEHLFVPSSDGKHTLNGILYIPDTAPKAYFQIVHGMTEYIGRYRHLLQDLCGEGYLVFGVDQVGHGSTSSNEDLGFIANHGGDEILVADIGRVMEHVKQLYPYDIPYYLLGHSMGSFIVRLAALNQPHPDKLIVMGTGGPVAATPAGIALATGTKMLYGPRHISPFLESLIFGAYNRHFEGESEKRWLSNDPDVITRYTSDDHCMFRFTTSALIDLLKLNQKSNQNVWFQSIARTEIPLLFVSGGDDPVGHYGEGVKKVCAKLSQCGADPVVHLYQGFRHEILNDASYPAVFNDILAFCNR